MRVEHHHLCMYTYPLKLPIAVAARWKSIIQSKWNKINNVWENISIFLSPPHSSLFVEFSNESFWSLYSMYKVHRSLLLWRETLKYTGIQIHKHAPWCNCMRKKARRRKKKEKNMIQRYTRINVQWVNDR